MKILLCERVNDLHHSIVLVEMPLTRFEECWPLPKVSLPEIPQNLNLNPLANQLWCIDFLTPPTPLIIPHRLPTCLESLMPLKNWCSIWSKSSLKYWHGFPWPSPAIHLQRLSLPAGLPGHNLCRTVVVRFLMVNQILLVRVKGSTGVHCLWIRPYFSSSVPRVFCIKFEWFSRLVAGGRTAAVLSDVVSRIYSKQLVAFLCNYHQAFSLLTQRPLGKNCVLFYRFGLIFVWPIVYRLLSMLSIVAYWYHFT